MFVFGEKLMTQHQSTTKTSNDSLDRKGAANHPQVGTSESGEFALGQSVQRARISPQRLSTNDVRLLQRTVGNQTVARMLGRSGPQPLQRQIQSTTGAPVV